MSRRISRIPGLRVGNPSASATHFHHLGTRFLPGLSRTLIRTQMQEFVLLVLE